LQKHKGLYHKGMVILQGTAYELLPQKREEKKIA